VELNLPGVVSLLAHVFGTDEVSIVDVRKLSVGVSRLSWAIDVRIASKVHDVVVQRERVPRLGRGSVEAEARLLRAAARQGVPVPAVVAADPVGVPIGGAYIITTRINGETIPRRILRAPELRIARNRFASECGGILARIHSIPVASVEPLPAIDPVEAIEQMLDSGHESRPVFDLGLDWLRSNRPVASGMAVVHGDFRNGNLIVGVEGIRAVLDWELSHVGDPLEDLGWLCARVWRWGGLPVVGGIGSRNDLLAAYAAAGGARVSVEQMFWWQLLATVRWGVMCLEQARTHLCGEYRSVELAAIGRRACEMEYEVLRMLA
jgi:aminoglycoside phosphotransferase (APT) family kinase protein